MAGKGTESQEWSQDWPNGQRSVSGKRRNGGKRRLSDQFETITFESITVYFIGPQAEPANEVFVTINVDLHSISSRPTALKAKLDTGAHGNILIFLWDCTAIYILRISHQKVFPNQEFLNTHLQCSLLKEGLMQHGKCQMISTAGNQLQLSLSQKQMDQPSLSCQHPWSSTSL